MLSNDAASELEVHPVDEGRWTDLERLFDRKGGPRGCWCMIWRASAEESRRTDAGSRREALRSRVRRGIPIGLLGYLEGEPVAWCSVAPRNTFQRLGGADYEGVSDSAVWSITCFYVRREVRRQHIATTLVRTAVSYARNAGAAVVEAYPVDQSSPSYRYMGLRTWFESAGFHQIGRAGSRRHIFALTATDADTAEADHHGSALGQVPDRSP